MDYRGLWKRTRLELPHLKRLNHVKEKIRVSECRLKEHGQRPVRSSEVREECRGDRLQFSCFLFPFKGNSSCGCSQASWMFSPATESSRVMPKWDFSFQRGKVWFRSHGRIKTILIRRECWAVWGLKSFNIDEYISPYILIKIKLSFLPGLEVQRVLDQKLTETKCFHTLGGWVHLRKIRAWRGLTGLGSYPRTLSFGDILPSSPKTSQDFSSTAKRSQASKPGNLGSTAFLLQSVGNY